MRSLTPQISTGVVFTFMLVFIFIVAIALYADLPQMIGVVSHFHWQYLSIILGLLFYIIDRKYDFRISIINADSFTKYLSKEVRKI